ncbi:hypothetical protein HMPREF1531_01199 [Propionibacterium sp. oral taxon 192 str. F0372]|uniref:hypothetical protein n=1 Tax=Propionibacterium sp. oral taxon 192 TaxID=671222 RepID=UPI000353274F|nr:hypothetical protein [Propionibacterium sp. oral taxon 192]EPH03773.1 hypothetical protein HMPREF1531_01199 [Propionibacterium sp. oral taxon 192 str. F0372]
MVAALEQINQATSILEEGYNTYKDVPESDTSLIDQLGLILNAQDWVPGGLITELVSFFVEVLPDFQDLLDKLAGDPEGIKSCAQAISKVGQDAGMAQAVAFHAATQAAGQNWSGPASDAFKEIAKSTQNLCKAYAKLPNLIGKMEMVVADNVGALRKVLRDGIHEMIQHIASQVMLGLGSGTVMIGGSTVGGTIVGGATGSFEGMKEGWESGGVWGATKGLFTGGAEGAVEGAKEGFETGKKAAIAQAIAWAYEFAADCLTHFVDLMNDTVSTGAQAMGKVRGAGETLHRAGCVLRGEKDPGPMGAPAAEGSRADQMKGNEPHAEDYGMALLNQHFDPPNTGDVPIPGAPEGCVYHQLDPNNEHDREILKSLGITPDMLQDENGFAAGVYVAQDKDGNFVDSNGNPLPADRPQVSVVMGATGDGPGQTAIGGADADVYEDGVGSMTVSPQTANAIGLATALEQSGHGDDTVYTGYSLGGRLAAEAAMATGGSAVTMNAAGVSDSTYDQIAAMTGQTPEEVQANANNSIRTYSTPDDPLTLAQEKLPGVSGSIHDAPGTHYTLEDPDSWDPSKGHSINDVVGSMQDPNRNSDLRSQHPGAGEWNK